MRVLKVQAPHSGRGNLHLLSGTSGPFSWPSRKLPFRHHPSPLGKPHRRRPSHDRHQAPGDVPDFYVSFRPSQPNTPPKKTLSKNTPTKNTLKIIPSPEKNTPQKIHQKNVVLLNCHSSLNSLNSHFPRRYHPKGPKGLIHLAPPVPLFKGVAITCSTSGGDTGW